MSRICECCGACHTKFLFKQDFNSKAISPIDKYDVVKCYNCGFIYADLDLTQDDLNEYYKSLSQYEFDYSKNLVSDKYIKHSEKIIDFILPFIKSKDASILDIGCSTGFLLSEFKNIGYTNLLGIDPSANCVKAVKGVYNINAVQDTIDSFLSEDKFDIIILSSVVEHLITIKESLKKIKSFLKENGKIFIEVPDANRFYEFIGTPYQQCSVEHINFFSFDSINMLCSNINLSVCSFTEETNYVNQAIDPCLFLLFKKDNVDAFESYLTKCKIKDILYRDKIESVLKENEEIIIWGVGTHTRRLLNMSLDFSNVKYFVDSNINYKDKNFIGGKKIRLPHEISDNIPILILSYSYQDEIIKQIKEDLNIPNEIIIIYE